MSEGHIVNLLWADDDCEGLLDPLSWRLERKGFRLWKRTNYTDALEQLQTERIDSLLADIILPHAGGTGTLRSNLGLELAEQAARRGVKSITFLTVVLVTEIEERYARLRIEHPEVSFEYVDKLLLLEPNTIERLIESLHAR